MPPTDSYDRTKRNCHIVWSIETLYNRLRSNLPSVSTRTAHIVCTVVVLYGIMFCASLCFYVTMTLQPVYSNHIKPYG
jgi:hypothetical protein